MKKIVLIVAFVVAVFASCDNKTVKVFIIYKEPINGNMIEVTLEWQGEDSHYADAAICIISDSNKFVVRQPISFDGCMDLFEKGKKNTAVWNYYYDGSKGPHLDWRTIVAFDDYDFDGEKELVICGFPRPFRDGVDKHWLDCEDFKFYKFTQSEYVRIHNNAFDELASGLCRTHYDFDTSNQMLTLIGVNSSFEHDTVVYYFRNGKVYDQTNW